MNFVDFTKLMVISFISSILITVIVCWGLLSIKVENLFYLGALLGMYVFACYGVNLLVDQKVIANNYSRFILAIVCILIYCWAFNYIMPIAFGDSIFGVSNGLDLNTIQLLSGIELNKEFFLTVFAAIVLIINFLDYRKS